MSHLLYIFTVLTHTDEHMAIYNVLHCSVGDSWTWLHLVIYKTPPSRDGIRRDLSPLQIPCGLCALITCGKYLPARVLIYWSTAVNIRRYFLLNRVPMSR